MRRSTEFSATVKRGVRVAQPDIVVHAQRVVDEMEPGPRIGLIINKSVGSAVVRHRVARRLRHAARAVLDDMDPASRVVIRALPSSRDTISACLEHELRVGLKRARLLSGTRS